MFGIFKKQDLAKNRKSDGAWGDGQAVLSAIDDGVLAIDPDGNIRIINQAAEEMIGWSNGDATGLVFESVFLLCDKDGNLFSREQNPIRKALANFECFTSRELFAKTQSGKNIPIFIRINSIDEQKTGLVVVFRNIAKELQENREQTEFISTASHEMRTPVASIEGYIGLALNPATATIDERAKKYLEKAHENTQHLGQLFQDLLDITKAEDGRLKNEPVVLDAVEFSRNIWDGLRAKASDKGLDYVFELDEKKSGEKILSPVYFIHVDKDHLHEVLDNLFENAIKYTPKGKVSVSVSGDNQNVFISVRDSGIGIPAEDIPHLFQKFYRVDNSETREISGTGLGLYLSRKLVESMNGKLSLESEYQKGSVFTVSLPRLTREQAEKFKEKELEKSQAEAKAESKDQIFDSSKEIIENTKEIESAKNQSAEQAPAQDSQTSPAQYFSQEQAIREYQLQQYYAKQKAANDAKMREERSRQNYQNAQNPYFPQESQPDSPVQNIPTQPQNISPPETYSPPAQNNPPTLSDIEKMREEYVKRMAAERQNIK